MVNGVPRDFSTNSIHYDTPSVFPHIHIVPALRLTKPRPQSPGRPGQHEPGLLLPHRGADRRPGHGLLQGAAGRSGETEGGKQI